METAREERTLCRLRADYGLRAFAEVIGMQLSNARSDSCKPCMQ